MAAARSLTSTPQPHPSGMYGGGVKGGGPAAGSGGSGGSSYLRNLGLPAQLSLLVGDVAVAVNFVVALLVPWVEARYRVANVWFPVFVPIKVQCVRGLLGRGVVAALAGWGACSQCMVVHTHRRALLSTR